MICLLYQTTTPSRQLARPATQRKTEKERQLADWRWMKGLARSQIIQRRDSPVLYKSFSCGNFCLTPQLGLEPMTHTTAALAERNLNGCQLILGNLAYMQTVHILQLVCANLNLSVCKKTKPSPDTVP
jgi:hypothetical protein